MGNKELLVALKEIKTFVNEKGVEFWLIGGLACAFHAGKLYREFGDIDLITKDKKDCDVFCNVLKKIGYEKVGEKNLADGLTIGVYQNREGISIDIAYYTDDFGLKRTDFEENEKELGSVKIRVLSKRFCKDYKKYLLTKRNEEKDILDLKMLE